MEIKLQSSCSVPLVVGRYIFKGCLEELVDSGAESTDHHCSRCLSIKILDLQADSKKAW